MENLFSYIRRLTVLPDDLKADLESVLVKEQVGKKEILEKAGQVCSKLYFVSSGCVRTYYYTKDDKEVSSWFYAENHFVTSWSSFLERRLSYEYLEVVEDAELYSIDVNSYQDLIRAHPAFERFARRLVEEQLTFVDVYFKGYMFLSAQERYELLLSYFPEVELRVGLGHIASFLGISIETLSRIRSRKNQN